MARKRDTIEPSSGPKRYARGDAKGQFIDQQSNLTRSLSQEHYRKAKTKVSKGQGDKGDQR